MSNKNNVKVAEAGIVGAVIGAALGAGAVAFSNPKNQKFIKNKFNEYKKDGQKVISDLKGKIEDVKSEAGDKIEETKKDLKKKL
jgi:gas vesicle protein